MALAIVQPESSADIPSGPVSWYGVARPFADSGFAGTMMSQLTLAAVVVAVLVADGATLALPLGHAIPDAGLVGVAAVVPVEADVGAAVPLVVGAVVAVPAVVG